MKRYFLIFLINLAVFVGYFLINLYRLWGVSGGDLGLMYLTIVGFIVHVVIAAPAIAYLFNKEKFSISYLVGIGGVVVGVLANYAILMASYQIMDQQFRKENPYYHSNYSSQDSTEYVKYDTDPNAMDFSNVNKRTIEKVLLNNLNLNTLPDEIAEIDSLVELSLSLNKSLDFKNSLSKLKKPSNLRSLNLVNCNLDSLPREVLLFKNLEKLYIGINPELNPNQVIAVLTELPNLRELWIQGNQWKNLPVSVSKLDRLELLYANGNNFEKLPDELNNMKSLERIFIRDNPVANNFTQFIDTSNVRVITNR